MTTNHRRHVTIDDETWLTLAEYAADTGENVSAVIRDSCRAYLTAHGYVFATEPRRYGRRGNGRQPIVKASHYGCGAHDCPDCYPRR